MRQLLVRGLLLCIFGVHLTARAAGGPSGDGVPADRPDIGIRFIIHPTVLVDVGTPVSPQVQVANHGNIEAPFRAWFRLLAPDSAQFYLESLDVAGLEPGLETTLVFPRAPVIVDTGNWFARCSVYAALDTNPANDLLDKPFRVGWVRG